MKQYASSERTKQALALSLKKFMEKKPLNKITVREIIEDCGVNRKTFYYHFQDIFDLTEWMFDRDAVDFIRQYNSVENYDDGFRFLFTYIRNNRHLCACALDSLGTANLKRFFYKDLNETVFSVIREAAAGLEVSQEYQEFLADFYLGALISVFMNWMRNGMDEEESEKIIRYLKLTLRGNLRSALVRADNPNHFLN